MYNILWISEKAYGPQKFLASHGLRTSSLNNGALVSVCVIIDTSYIERC